MTCGRVPHRADSMVRTLAMQMLDPVEPPTKVRPDLHIPTELEEIILHALAKKREEELQARASASEREAKQREIKLAAKAAASEAAAKRREEEMKKLADDAERDAKAREAQLAAKAAAAGRRC